PHSASRVANDRTARRPRSLPARILAACNAAGNALGRPGGRAHARVAALVTGWACGIDNGPRRGRISDANDCDQKPGPVTEGGGQATWRPTITRIGSAGWAPAAWAWKWVAGSSRPAVTSRCSTGP